jgi:hypothetical protein
MQALDLLYLGLASTLIMLAFASTTDLSRQKVAIKIRKK